MTTGRKALLTNDLAMLLYGISAVLIGPTLPGMIAQFDLSLSAAGLIATMQNAGGFIGAVVALVIADRFSRPGMILVSFALLAAALFAVGTAERYLTLVIAFAASGLCIRVLDVMLNAHTGELAEGNSGKALSTLHMFYSIGAFVGPLVVRGLVRTTMAWSGVYQIVAAGYLLVLIGAAGFFRSYLDSGRRRSSREQAPAVKRHTPSRSSAALVGMLSFLLFFYAIHQIGLVAWLPYYLEVGRGASSDLASYALSMYWIGIIAGRFISSRVVVRIGARRILCIGTLLAAAATAGGILVPSPAWAVVLVAAAGMTSGATIPLAYSVGYTLLPQRTGSVTAWMSIIMLAGRLLGPWFIGTVADHVTLLVAMLIPAAALMGSGTFAAVVLLAMPERGREQPSALRG